MAKKIILASGSPRRKQLLRTLLGDNFEIKISTYQEDNTLKMSPRDLVLYHSCQKGRDVVKKLTKGVVISADTVVVFQGQVLGKPNNARGAKEMLQTISGKIVEVISGLCLIDVEAKKEIQDYEITQVKMKKMTEKEINDYVNSGEPLDKSGAFGIQERGAIFVENVDGCPFNVAGLPLFKLNQLLNELGISIFDYIFTSHSKFAPFRGRGNDFEEHPQASGHGVAEGDERAED